MALNYLTCFNAGPKSTYSGHCLSSKDSIGIRGTASIFVVLVQIKSSLMGDNRTFKYYYGRTSMKFYAPVNSITSNAQLDTHLNNLVLMIAEESLNLTQIVFPANTV